MPSILADEMFDRWDGLGQRGDHPLCGPPYAAEFRFDQGQVNALPARRQHRQPKQIDGFSERNSCLSSRVTVSVVPRWYTDHVSHGKDESMITAHAQNRLQQRAIPAEAVDTLLAYGERRRGGGADVYFLDRSARARAATALGQEQYNRLERSLNTYLVLADGGSLITAAHRRQRLKF